ncbi:hypothetical protein RB195_002457 [Necator americanus]|uniref:Reverse transcriptase domain-containing protein n=1 Tax=Necator americanus TaxID=51031 RepID=A0ABR1DJ55_NECAM
MSSRREMKIITERFYSNLFRSSIPVSSPIIPTDEALPRIFPSEVRVAIKNMKPGTATGPDFISADFLWGGGHPLHVILAAHTTSYLQKERIPEKWKIFGREPFLSTRKTVSRVIEICREYRLPLVLTFVDYEKAFDSVEMNAILSSLVDQGSQIVETSSYVSFGRSMNMENDLKEKLNKRMRAAWAAFAPVRDATD